MRAVKWYLRFLAVILSLVIVLPCAGFERVPGNTGEITASGTVKKQGVTTYMYGTHVLVDDHGKTLYALRSGNIDLDAHVGRKVTVKGNLVEGYPVDFGPPYLDVKYIE